MYKEIENWYEPVDSLSKFNSVTEMTRWESGFLCGLLKKFRPHKILEVGVAGGGTSVIIRKALEMLGLDDSMHYSGDLSEKYYRKRDEGLVTGFQYDVACERNLISEGNHKLYIGNYLPEYIEDIGGEIDFVILDTVHSAPGELLDLLVVLPYLSETAIIVFHDLATDHQNHYRQTVSINKCLFDSLDGEKYFNICGNDIDRDMLYGYSDIGGVVISNRENCIRDLFSMFGLPWAYMPSDKELDIYRKKYACFYDAKYIEMFDLIVKVQRHTWKHNSLEGKRRLITEFKRKISEKKIYLFGNGKRGRKLYHFIEMIGGHIEGWCVSDEYKTEKQENGLPVYTLQELGTLKEEKLIIVATTFLNIIDDIENSGIEYYIPNPFIINQSSLYDNL
ncbi:class I SAM-dependent methyltransferase [bacterium D16-51]|nr:class I SAM-dependent methyltransferase [bacterium D16-59]RKI62313.1 class I SAM-dependent methyltransferase [bacterium D16-51]